MLTWKITDLKGNTKIIKAKNFDAALKEARKENKDYVSGQVIE